MAFLQLKNIGKIYVSEGTVAVGIRNVNLSFERGEFVAITGASGSGKSTLLNVISGMDTYEEGEMYIEGKPTSHFLQPDWEEYREKYISFIFQDYNIIESFTVLQNVELALMDIANPIERRRRAIELLRRVGLEKHLKQKGSRLSGGQKQRCVIARALAKDSPVILADEPTGNLDAESSKEIVELLREVSKDKLLIVVTHNFDEVQDYATRHVRVFDSAVESDHVIREDNTAELKDLPPVPEVEKKRGNDVRNGFRLGWASFGAKPKLTIFICIILFAGTIGAAAVSGLMGNVFSMFKRFYMFTPSKGRVVVSHTQPEAFTDEQLADMVKKYGAESYVRYDAIMDAKVVYEMGNVYFSYTRFGQESDVDEMISFGATEKHFGSPSIGRYPEDSDEVLLYVPLCYKNYFGSDTIRKDIPDIQIGAGGSPFEVVGIKYYIDNSKTAQLVVTHDAYMKIAETVSKGWSDFRSLQKESDGLFDIIYMFEGMMNPDDGIYNQASLIFSSNAKAKKAAKTIMKDGYLACHSKETFSPGTLDIVERILAGGWSFILWCMAIAFLIFFVNLCTHRSLDVIKNDLTIYRSMGISVRVIKISLFMRMYVSVIPGLIVTTVLAFFAYLSPNYNNMFRFLHAGDYIMIVLGILLITTFVTRRQIKRLFEDSVKKTLKGEKEA